ncbi:MAG: YihY/virulence factor BrkB family protein [Cytophagaceae bacterium]
MRNFFTILKNTVIEYIDDEPFDLSAIVAYYSIFSLPAVLLIIISIAGMFFGENAVEGEISHQIAIVLGEDAANQVQMMIANAYQEENTVLMTVVGIGVLLFGATTVLASMKRSLNRIWRVKTKKETSAIKKLAIDRIISFGIILAVGFLLLISLIVTTALATFGSWLRSVFPDMLYFLFFVVDFIVSMVVIAILFAMLFKFLPDVRVQWKSVWMGSLFTAFLFLLGKFGMGIYFGNLDPGSSFGAAGSVVLLLLWVNYSCLILFLGAKFTKKNAEFHNHFVEPKPNAEWTPMTFGA